MKHALLPLSRRVAVAMLCLLSGPVAAEVPLTPLASHAARIVQQDVIRGAYEIVHAPELGLVFVAAAPSLAEGTGGTIHTLDATDLRPVRRIDLPDQAFGLAMDHTTGRLYVGHTMSGAVSVLDARSGVLLDRVQLGRTDTQGKVEHTRMIEVDEATGRVFVSSPSRSGTVWIIDSRNDNAVRRVDNVGLWAAGLAQDSAAARLYVSGGGIEEIGVIDTVTGTRISGFSTGDTTEAGAEASKHFLLNLAFDRERGRLFATDASTGSLYVFDTATGTTIATLPIGKGILDTVFNPARNEVYVTWRGVGRDDHEGSGGLAIIDGATLEVRSRIGLPVHPNSLAVSADGNLLYLTVKQPLDKAHPAYRVDAVDTVIRFDLTS